MTSTCVEDGVTAGNLSVMSNVGRELAPFDEDNFVPTTLQEIREYKMVNMIDKLHGHLHAFTIFLLAMYGFVVLILSAATIKIVTSLFS